MKFASILWVAMIAGCGGASSMGDGGAGGGTDAGCTQLYEQFHALVDPPQSCTVDSDCVVVLDSCFGPAYCAAYVTTRNDAAARQLVDEGGRVCQCVTCGLPPPPACIAGVCGQTRFP
jgi:hypothetical protein